MRKMKCFLGFAFFLGVFTLSLSAQSRVLTKAEYDALTKEAFAKTAKRVRREITEDRSYAAGVLTEEEVTTQEFLPPDKEKWLIVNRSGDTTTRTEIVYLGRREYRRENSGPWKKIGRDDPKNKFTIVGDINSAKAIEVVTYSLEDRNAAGATVRVLFEKSNLAYGFSPGLQTRRITLDKDGHILKIEDSVSEPTPDEVVYTSVQTVDYSPKGIRIEPPIK